MAFRPKITGRGTSLAAAFVQAIIPRHEDKTAQASIFTKNGIQEKECVYCGDKATDMDHFRAIVKGGRPSGHFHTVDNLVPSCGPCNQSKGGQNWLHWMRGTAKGSPTTRMISYINERIERLSRFEQEASEPEGLTQAELRDKVGCELWDGYWQKLEDIKLRMAEAQKDADEIRIKLDVA